MINRLEIERQITQNQIHTHNHTQKALAKSARLQFGDEPLDFYHSNQTTRREAGKIFTVHQKGDTDSSLPFSIQTWEQCLWVSFSSSIGLHYLPLRLHAVSLSTSADGFLSSFSSSSVTAAGIYISAKHRLSNWRIAFISPYKITQAVIPLNAL